MLVKVITRSFSGVIRRSRIRYRILWVMVNVLPEPGPASNNSGPSPNVTASCWEAFKHVRSDICL